MSVSILVSHAESDADLAARVAAFLAASVEGLQVFASSLPGREAAGGDDSLAALKQRLSEARVVIALVTGTSRGSGEVAFQLGAAWALGAHVVLLLDPDDSDPGLYLPMGHGESLVLSADTLVGLAESLATELELSARVGEAARSILAELYPAWEGFDRQSGERPVSLAPGEEGAPALAAVESDPSGFAASEPDPSGFGASERDSGSTQRLWPVDPDVMDAPAYAGATQLPSCRESYEAGRAFGDCLFHGAGPQEADALRELDGPLGGFLTTLGVDWETLRRLEDIDVWQEATENILGGLDAEAAHVRGWYEVGLQLSTLLNLASLAGGDVTAQARDAAAIRWQQAVRALFDAGSQLGVAQAELDGFVDMLANIAGPESSRDYTNVGRLQERVRGLAGHADA